MFFYFYIRSECSKFIKIIQERVLDSDSGDIDANGFALMSAQKTGRQAVDGYSLFSPNESSPTSSSLQMHRCDNTAVGTIPKLTHTDQSPFIQNSKSVQPVSAFACKKKCLFQYILTETHLTLLALFHSTCQHADMQILLARVLIYKSSPRDIFLLSAYTAICFVH